MRDFKRITPEAALLTAETPAQVERFRYFASRGISVQRGGALWRVIDDKGEATFSLQRIIELNPARRDAFAAPVMGVG